MIGDETEMEMDRKTLRKKYPYSELFWSSFSLIRTEYGRMRTRITSKTDTFLAVREKEMFGITNKKIQYSAIF